MEDWLDKPEAERNQWYENELCSIANYLESKEPFTKDQVITSLEWLEEIKERIELDQGTGGNGSFHRNVDEASELIPSYNIHPKHWVGELYAAAEVFIGFD